MSSVESPGIGLWGGEWSAGFQGGAELLEAVAAGPAGATKCLRARASVASADRGAHG